MVDPEEGSLEGNRESLRRRHPHGQGSDEPRPRRHGNTIDIREGTTSIIESRLDRRNHLFQVGPRSNLGHDSSESRVLVHGTRDRLAEQTQSSDQGDPGLVARTLDSQDKGIHETTL